MYTFGRLPGNLVRAPVLAFGTQSISDCFYSSAYWQ